MIIEKKTHAKTASNPTGAVPVSLSSHCHQVVILTSWRRKKRRLIPIESHQGPIQANKTRLKEKQGNRTAGGGRAGPAPFAVPSRRRCALSPVRVSSRPPRAFAAKILMFIRQSRFQFEKKTFCCKLLERKKRVHKHDKFYELIMLLEISQAHTKQFRVRKLGKDSVLTLRTWSRLAIFSLSCATWFWAAWHWLSTVVNELRRLTHSASY